LPDFAFTASKTLFGTAMDRHEINVPVFTVKAVTQAILTENAASVIAMPAAQVFSGRRSRGLSA
jgi:hypothetical protein